MILSQIKQNYITYCLNFVSRNISTIIMWALWRNKVQKITNLQNQLILKCACVVKMPVYETQRAFLKLREI